MKEDQTNQQTKQNKRFTLSDMPAREEIKQGLQIDMFDPTPAQDLNRALDYIKGLDATVVEKASAVMVSLIKITDPNQEILALIAAKAPAVNQYVFKLYSNVKEMDFTAHWRAFSLVAKDIESVARLLKEYNYSYVYQGDHLLQEAFGLQKQGEKASSLLFKRNENALPGRSKKRKASTKKV